MELDHMPDLVDPVMLAAFEGWNDAGEAASDAIAFLADAWQASIVGEMDPEDYYDFQVNRPLISSAEDGERRLQWPTTRLLVARPPLQRRDIVLVQGIEPSMRWRGYTAELLGAAYDLGVEMVITLGALLADTPHTRPVPVTGTTVDAALRQRLGLEESRYEGPTGIVGVVQEACSGAGLPAASLWAAVPHYVAAPPSPKAMMALLGKVEDLLEVSIPMGELADEARAWQTGADELAAEDEEIGSYVRGLEEAQDAAELPEASGEAIAREFERFLRRQGEDPPPG